mmetsp:Transcript_48126/g.121496  ORF Transcript_48126/g.121496 Transcript_48126/m.121496 type:complete len:314 (-) Transcript_48126:181-1122(-)
MRLSVCRTSGPDTCCRDRGAGCPKIAANAACHTSLGRCCPSSSLFRLATSESETHEGAFPPPSCSAATSPWFPSSQRLMSATPLPRHATAALAPVAPPPERRLRFAGAPRGRAAAGCARWLCAAAALSSSAAFCLACPTPSTRCFAPRTSLPSSTWVRSSSIPPAPRLGPLAALLSHARACDPLQPATLAAVMGLSRLASSRDRSALKGITLPWKSLGGCRKSYGLWLLCGGSPCRRCNNSVASSTPLACSSTSLGLSRGQAFPAFVSRFSSNPDSCRVCAQLKLLSPKQDTSTRPGLPSLRILALASFGSIT